MVIDDRTVKRNLFGDLPVGSVFKSEYGAVWIKVAVGTNPDNAFRLDDNQLLTLKTTDRVQVCEAKVVIE